MTCKKWKARMDAISPTIQNSMISPVSRLHSCQPDERFIIANAASKELPPTMAIRMTPGKYRLLKSVC
jgi:hypothetical protein